MIELELKSSRKILCSLLCVVISVALSIALTVGIFDMTFTSPRFVTKYFATEELAARCEEQLDLRFEALAEKSSIPARVFQAIKTQNSIDACQDIAVDYFFNGSDCSLYSQSRIDSFKKLCTEYLDGNNIKYSQEDVDNTAEEAARIFSECVGISGFKTFQAVVSDINEVSPKIVLSSLMIGCIAALLVFLLFSQKKNGLAYLCASVTSSGISVFIVGVLCLILKAGKDSILIQPEAYRDAMMNCINTFYILLVSAGIAIFLIGLVLTVFTIQAYKKEKTKKESRLLKRFK